MVSVHSVCDVVLPCLPLLQVSTWRLAADQAATVAEAAQSKVVLLEKRLTEATAALQVSCDS